MGNKSNLSVSDLLDLNPRKVQLIVTEAERLIRTGRITNGKIELRLDLTEDTRKALSDFQVSHVRREVSKALLADPRVGGVSVNVFSALKTKITFVLTIPRLVRK